MTTDGPAGQEGVAVSTICSVSVGPPTFLVCVHGHSAAVGAIRGNGAFSVNVLTQKQTVVSDCVAGRTDILRDLRFVKPRWERSEWGLPMLVDALAVFDCDLQESPRFGSHYVFIGAVRRLHARDIVVPLIYTRKHYAMPAALAA